MKNIGNNTVQIEALNSFGLGRRLYNAHAGKLFYVEEKNYWLVWNGKQFICSKIKVEQMARELIESTIRKELDISHRDKITDTYKNNITHEDILKFIDNITGIFGIQSTLAGGRLIPALTTSDSEFDTHFDFLNTPNGVVNLKTGELLAHNPEYKFTKITRTEYHPEAKSKKFETFLNKITNNNPELIEYLQRIMGYALTGSTKEQIFFIFCGDGANGKSTFFNLFKSVLGLYAQSTPAQTLLATKGSVINADEARLQGARFVVAVEVNDRQKFDEAKVKRLTGSDGIVARFLRQNFFEFKPEFKLFIAVNNLPMVTPNKAIFRRIQVIPFNAKFDDDLNKDMEEELLMDSQAILAWAVEGARKWYSEGLCVCNAVNNATEGYRKSADVVQRFLSEDQIIKQGTGRRIPVGELYDTYKAWATENGEECIQKNQFGHLIKLKGFEGTKSGSIRYWQGLDLKYR